jgi:RNA polymerase sigma-54 factor
LKRGPQDKGSKAWLGECLASANWLVKALDQRARTIVKVASEIVKQQHGFFERGVSALRPLTLAKVAEAIEMHESTVSRVTSNKYLACDRGMLSSNISSGRALPARAGKVPAEAVKAAIKDIIDDETEVLSDDAIAHHAGYGTTSPAGQSSVSRR